MSLENAENRTAQSEPATHERYERCTHSDDGERARESCTGNSKAWNQQRVQHNICECGRSIRDSCAVLMAGHVENERRWTVCARDQVTCRE